MAFHNFPNAGRYCNRLHIGADIVPICFLIDADSHSKQCKFKLNWFRSIPLISTQNGLFLGPPTADAHNLHKSYISPVTPRKIRTRHTCTAVVLVQLFEAKTACESFPHTHSCDTNTRGVRKIDRDHDKPFEKDMKSACFGRRYHYGRLSAAECSRVAWSATRKLGGRSNRTFNGRRIHRFGAYTTSRLTYNSCGLFMQYLSYSTTPVAKAILPSTNSLYSSWRTE